MKGLISDHQNKAVFLRERITRLEWMIDIVKEIIENNQDDIKNVDKYLSLFLSAEKQMTNLMQSKYFVPNHWRDIEVDVVNDHEEELKRLDGGFEI